MKILAALFVAVLAASPVNAQSFLPEEFLMQGLASVSVCIRSKLSAADKIQELLEVLIKEDPKGLSEDDQKLVGRAVKDLTTLEQGYKQEQELIVILVDGLVKHHNRSEEDLGKVVDTAVALADAEMATTFKDVNDYEEFSRVFQPKLNACSEMIDKMMMDAKKYNEGIEKNK